MEDLLKKKCVPCEGGVKPFSSETISEYQKRLTLEWRIIEKKQIEREFNFKTFDEAIDFVNKVATIARKQNHHPDIYIFYNKVRINLWTHAISGLSVNDFIVARQIEHIFE